MRIWPPRSGGVEAKPSRRDPCHDPLIRQSSVGDRSIEIKTVTWIRLRRIRLRRIWPPRSGGVEAKPSRRDPCHDLLIRQSPVGDRSIEIKTVTWIRLRRIWPPRSGGVEAKSSRRDPSHDPLIRQSPVGDRSIEIKTVTWIRLRRIRLREADASRRSRVAGTSNCRGEAE